MLGAKSKYSNECYEGQFIGAGFLYSSCKEVSKQKSTSWINSKIKEMGLA